MVEAKIKALRDELERHNYNYYVLSAPTISDFEFDKMMKELQELEAAHPDLNLPELSCGMSEDFEPALEEGSTLVRLGRVVFSPEFAVK